MVSTEGSLEVQYEPLGKTCNAVANTLNMMMPLAPDALLCQFSVVFRKNFLYNYFFTKYDILISGSSGLPGNPAMKRKGREI